MAPTLHPAQSARRYFLIGKLRALIFAGGRPSGSLGGHFARGSPVDYNDRAAREHQCEADLKHYLDGQGCREPR